jgi:MerR family transcriptional regulator, light-induced transcriptional regulator
VSTPSGRAEYSIAAVSKLTGVSCHALRVWERRYGCPSPRRSPSGHRRYGADQVRLLRLVVQQLQAGRTIGEVMADLRDGRLGAAEAPGAAAVAESPALALVDRLAVGDLGGAEAEYDRAAASATPAELVERLIAPALIDAGERWFRGEFEVFQERCASVFLRRKLHGLIDAAHRANPAPRHTAVIGTVQGDRHEGGVLMLGLLLELSGWRAQVLGVDLPVREFQRVAERWRPDALGLSFVLSRNINKRFRELARIRDVPIFVGGRSILNYQGLARRHGLIPLAGPIGPAFGQWMARFEEWHAAPGGPPRPGATRHGGAP